MVNDSSISLKMRAVVLTIVILSCEGRMNPSSIMLPNIGTDAAYEVISSTKSVLVKILNTCTSNIVICLVNLIR